MLSRSGTQPIGALWLRSVAARLLLGEYRVTSAGLKNAQIDLLPTQEGEQAVAPKNPRFMGQYYTGATNGIKKNLDHLTQVIADTQAETVLDVGCMDGYTWETVKTTQAEYLGVDINQEAIDYAREHYPGGAFYRSNLFALDERFKADVVFCSRVLIHLPNFKQAVDHLRTLANKALVLVIKIGPKDDLKKYQVTDTEEQAIVYHRIFSEKTVREAAGKCTIIPGKYSTVII